MSAFSDRIRGQKKGHLFRVADLEHGERTLTITHLDEQMEIFGETKDILNFAETGQQLQINQTVAEWLLDTLGDEPDAWTGKQVVLHLAEYQYNNKTERGIRLKLPGSGDGTALPSRKAVSPPRKPEFDDDMPY